MLHKFWESVLGSSVSNQAKLVNWVHCSRSGTYALALHFEVNKRCSESGVNWCVTVIYPCSCRYGMRVIRFTCFVLLVLFRFCATTVLSHSNVGYREYSIVINMEFPVSSFTHFLKQICSKTWSAMRVWSNFCKTYIIRSSNCPSIPPSSCRQQL